MEGGYPTPEEAKAAWELEQQYLHPEFCLNCGKKRPYHVSRRQEKMTVRGVEFVCPEYVAHCAACGREIYVPTVNDRNVEIHKRYYQEAMEKHGKGQS